MQQQSAFNVKWIARFDFFEQNGLPGSVRYGQAIRKLKFLQRSRYMFNFYAFFFGLIYFCILGLWKKGLVLVAIIVVIQLGLVIAEDILNSDFGHISRAMNIAYSAFCALSVNSAYYIRKIKGSDSWNPFQGMTRKSAEELEKLPSRNYN
ncbi:DUF2628 domain-containing protein [Salmonella enterica]|nr:DUF2628 domain-containing protein [Salmonella enterica]EDR7525030.1 DUF2628 domain-containing protein [Salmonella enterica subsp. enterica serovar Oranienburg]EIM5533041.1 DUF2628 domain-containing protein [Salmonella enterica subsp. enterica]